MKKSKPIKTPWKRNVMRSPQFRRCSVIAVLLCNTIIAHAIDSETVGRSASILFQQSKIYTGTVKDVSGIILQGVSISLKDQKNALTSTDINGRFVVEVEAKSILVFKLVGYTPVEVPLDGIQNNISVTLTEDSQGIDEVVVVGFGTQKKESNVGSQSTIKRAELKVPVANLSTAIAGRLAGVVATQRSGGPGSDGANLFVRGVATFASSPQTPLLIVDGVPDRDINNIDPEDIESFTILKDATATAVYGTRGANGVIIINTRKGKAGKPSISAEVQQGITGFTYLPEFVDGPTFMELFNEGLTMRGKNAFYNEERIEKHRTGEDPDLYPNVNWYEVLFNDNATNNRLNVNITGGADVANYYLSLGYYNETGQFKTEDIDTYNSALKEDRFNFTSNLTVNITPRTKLDFGLNGYLKNYNEPARGRNSIFALATEASPHIIPVQYSDGSWSFVRGASENPYKALTQSGINNRYDNVVRSNLRLTQNLDMITNGLSTSGLFAFDVFGQTILTRSRNLPSYFAEGRDTEGNLILTNTGTGSPDLSFSLNRSSTRRLYAEASLNYNREFGLHDVGGLLLFNQSDYSDAGSGVNSYQAAIPYRNRNLVGRATYAYNRKYLFESNFSYSGSDNFTPNNRFGLFSSLGLGWVVSNERFFESAKDYIQHLKLRYSYGTSGNSNTSDRFLYLTRYSQSGGSYNFGTPGSQRGYTGYIESLLRGDVTWETSYRHNVGVEFNAFNNNLQVIAELFKEDRKGILMPGDNIPFVSGFNAGNIPYKNIGETANKGVDLTLEYNKHMSNGFFMARGTMNYNTNTVVMDNKPPWAFPYLDREGHRISQRFGYIDQGLFKSEEEIANSATQAGDVRVGDIRYKDLNGDGIINSNDQTAIGYGSTPLLTYGITLGGGYKGFDLSLFFQGSGMVDLNYSSGHAVTPFSQGATFGNMYTNLLDRWDSNNPDKKTLYPRLSTNETVTTNYYTSTWWLKRSDFIRLKQAEFGYNFENKSWLSRVGVAKMRIYANGTNLFTISRWDFWDPELGDGRGTAYPITRVYNVGLRLNFK
ncbi:SusC/RagA family TonB-linked outer membrane protein [Sphingobacterium sp. SGL-16]|uniref:SusC/RagA family TonB-linked outer membrane protein n=1 Tax=Sphingobacterium sp. SGL-16 TaxID=2710883 RepID=UPI0013EBA5AA|nr:TonB-dependent receptor [Sphingobacterium sp. SGL-16]NGM73446.1 TonB-dependent receptor [Sphingobacterium sp. SGL-16]